MKFQGAVDYLYRLVSGEADVKPFLGWAMADRP